jgi:hypothetical protein
MAEIELGNDWTVVGKDGGDFIIEDDQGNRTKIDNSGNINASALTTNGDVVVGGKVSID